MLVGLDKKIEKIKKKKHVPLSTEEGSDTHGDSREQLPVPGLNFPAVLVAKVASGTQHGNVDYIVLEKSVDNDHRRTVHLSIRTDTKRGEPVLGVAREVVPASLELLHARVHTGTQTERVRGKSQVHDNSGMRLHGTYLFWASLARSSSSSASLEMYSPTLPAVALASS